MKYCVRGWRLLQLDGKKPVQKDWPNKASADLDIVTEWFDGEYRDSNIGVVTGKLSNLTVIDVDVKTGGLKTLKILEDNGLIPITLRSKTGSGGTHIFLQFEPRLKTGAGILPGIDIRGEGGQIVLPPSIHPDTGNEYSWNCNYEETQLAKLPEDLIELFKLKDTRKDKELGGNITEGKRNTELTSYGGSIWNSGCSEKVLLVALQIRNSEFPEPLESEEVERTWESVRKMDRSSSKGKTKCADAIVAMIMAQKPELFVSQEDVSYIRLTQEEQITTMPINSKEFQYWVRNEMYNLQKIAISKEALNNAISTLEGLASVQGNRREVFVRMARHDGCIYYDLCNKNNEAIKISSNSVDIVPNPGIFIRYGHMKEQCLPKATIGDPFEKLLKFLPMEYEDQILTLVWLVTAFIPDIAHPILCPYGERGSGKSILFKVLRELIDPSLTPIMPLPQGLDDLYRMAHHSYMLMIDNSGSLPNATSDALCCITTGTAISRRILYTNDDDRIAVIRRIIGINGVILPGIREDLLDRMLIFEVKRLQNDKIKPESILMNEFERDKPEIITAILETLKKAIEVMEKGLIEPPVGFRMADFAMWAAAVGYAWHGPEGPEIVLECLKGNTQNQNGEAAFSSPLATAIIEFAKMQKEWTGTPSEFHKEVTFIAENNLGINTRQNYWPGSPSWSVRKAKALRDVLNQNGVVFDEGKKSNGDRQIHIKYKNRGETPGAA